MVSFANASNLSLFMLLFLINFSSAILNKTGDKRSLYLKTFITLKGCIYSAPTLILQWMLDIVIFTRRTSFISIYITTLFPPYIRFSALPLSSAGLLLFFNLFFTSLTFCRIGGFSSSSSFLTSLFSLLPSSFLSPFNVSSKYSAHLLTSTGYTKSAPVLLLHTWGCSRLRFPSCFASW